MSRSCAGIPFVGVRSLTDEERAWLSDRARRARRRRIVYGVGTAFVPLILCVPLALATVDNALALLMLPALWSCLFLPTRWLDARKRGKVAIASAYAEEAEVYEGVPGLSVLTEASLSGLVAAGLTLDDETSHRIDRIAASGETVALDGERLDPPLWTDVSDVALPERPSVEFPSRIPEFAFHALPNTEHRALTSAEIAELRRLAPERVSLRQSGCLLAVCAYLFAGSFQTIEGQPELTKLFVLLRIVLLGYLGWRIALAIREGQRLRRDLAEGAVVIFDHEGTVVELLPHLRLAWTVDGEPTPWRHAAQRKPRPPL